MRTKTFTIASGLSLLAVLLGAPRSQRGHGPQPKPKMNAALRSSFLRGRRTRGSGTIPAHSRGGRPRAPACGARGRRRGPDSLGRGGPRRSAPSRRERRGPSGPAAGSRGRGPGRPPPPGSVEGSSGHKRRLGTGRTWSCRGRARPWLLCTQRGHGPQPKPRMNAALRSSFLRGRRTLPRIGRDTRPPSPRRLMGGGEHRSRPAAMIFRAARQFLYLVDQGAPTARLVPGEGLELFLEIEADGTLGGEGAGGEEASPSGKRH